MSHAIKSVPYQPIGEANFVGEKHRCSPSSTIESHSGVRAKKHIPAVSSTDSERLFRAGDHFSVGLIVPPPELQKQLYVEGPISNCEEAMEALLKRVKEL